MRVSVILFGAFLACGCARHKAAMPPVGANAAATFAEPAVATQSDRKLIVTPANSLVGKVARINTAARFVVLNFPIGTLPVIDQRLNLYRQGLKVGEVRVTGPQFDDNVVADVVTGDAQVGDEARDK
jgi:hypothetical protein